MFIVRRTNDSTGLSTPAILEGLRAACPGIDVQELEMDAEERRVWLLQWFADEPSIATKLHREIANPADAPDGAILEAIRELCGEDVAGIEYTTSQISDPRWMRALHGFVEKQRLRLFDDDSGTDVHF